MQLVSFLFQHSYFTVPDSRELPSIPENVSTWKMTTTLIYLLFMFLKEKGMFSNVVTVDC
jgi:hypothetical protein